MKQKEDKVGNSNKLISRLYRQKKNTNTYSSVTKQATIPIEGQYLVPKIVKNKLKPLEKDPRVRSKLFSNHQHLTEIKPIQSGKSILDSSYLNLKTPAYSRVRSKMYSVMDDSVFIDKEIAKSQVTPQENKKYLTPNDFMEILKIDQEMSQQFCYMNKRDHPYDWQIIEFEKKNPAQYMVISKRGLTKYLQNQVQFINFETFLSQQTIFNKLLEIQYFRIFQRWKSFQLWKKYTSINVFRQRSKEFSEKTLLSDPNLKEIILQIRTLCKNMETIDAFYIQTLSSMRLEDFKLYSEKQKYKTIGKVKDIEDLILNLILKRTGISMEIFMKKMRISKDSKGNFGQKKVPLLIGDQTAKDMPYTESATLRTHQTRIRNLLKLADYLMITSKTQFIINMITKLEHTLAEINSLYQQDKKSFANTAWILLQIQQDNGQIKYTPQRQILTQQIQQIVYGTLTQICNNYYQYLHCDQFQQYWKCNTQAQRTDQIIQIKSIININPYFNQEINKFKLQIQQNFQNLQKYIQIYNRSLDLLQYIRRMEAIDLMDQNTDFFRQAMLNCRTQMKALQQLENQKQIGILMVNCYNYKQLIQKSMEIFISKIHHLIPDILLSRTQKMLKDMKQNYAKVQYTPITIKDYIDFRHNTKDVGLFVQNLVPIITDNTDLLTLSQSYSVKVPQSVKNIIGDANGQMIGLKRRLDEIEKGANQMAQKFKKQIQKLIPIFGDRIKFHNEKLLELQIYKNTDKIQKKIQNIKLLGQSLQIIIKQKNQLQGYQQSLTLQISPFQQVQQYQKFFKQVQLLWVQKLNWKKFIQTNYQKLLSILDFENVRKYLQQITKKLIIIQRQLQPNQVLQILKTQIDKFKPLFITVQALKNQQMKQKHYDQIRNIIKNNFKNRNQELLCGQGQLENLFVNMDNVRYSLKFFKELEVDKFKDQITQISIQAIKQAELTQMIIKVQSIWRSLSIVTTPYKEKQGTILGNNDDLISKIDDNLLIVNNILGSKYVGPIKPRVQIQSKMLRYVQDLIDEWYLHQKNWIYLQPIFKSPFAIKNLPKQSSMFTQIDNKWKIIMKQAKDSSSIKIYADQYHSHHTMKVLIHNNQTFSQVQKTLQNFLQKKRDIFQRFYFLSNDQLLEILSTVKSYQQIQTHLRKVFENFIKLHFDDKGIPESMESMEGEIVVLRNCVFRGEVQQWFKTAEESMKNTLKSIVRQSLTKYTQQGMKRVNWINLFPSQIVLVVDCIMWTSITQGYLQDSQEMDMYQWYQTNVSQLNQLVQLIRTDLSSLQRKTLVALITQDVHFRDIVQNLQSCQSSQDFKWLQQLRFYYNNQLVYARQVQAELYYGYQYLGATSRLVITPLTDRCWITITGALHIKLGANPAGPAGTGKTESCKDLAKSLARYCIVFNCSDQINAQMMQKLFSGLAYTGSWTCLDQFNRIDIQVLSVIAQQVLTIRQALLIGKHNKQLLLGGKTITLNHDLGIFITMNPGYAGRTQLPDNLKTLFRPVSMMVPDYTLIAQIMLFSQGFTSAKDLSKKMTKLYKLSSQQLSQQDHYDFGMRAVKSVLVMAGTLKRAQPNVPEDITLIRAMQDSNIPKFLSQDIPLFNGIIQDLFPGVIIPETDQTIIIKKVQSKCKQLKILPTPKFIQKNIQLNETLKVRFGVMLVGPPMGSKTSIIKTLLDKFPIVINPKSVSLAQLYGNFDPLTLTWTDGLASKLLRQSVTSQQYVLFDGPVDSLWIQNLNTVLDDSMMLCLSNGERIKLNSKMRILFEVMDLNQASPATVSRCGMVWVSQQTIESQDLISSFFIKYKVLQSQQKLQYLSNMVKSSFRKGYTYIKKFCKEMIKLNQSTLAHSYCKFIKNTIGIIPNSALELDTWKKALQKICVYSFVWSVGAIVSQDSRSRVDKSLSQCFSPDSLKNPIINFTLSYKDKPQGQWHSWNSIMPQFQFINGVSFSQIFVPTKQTYCYSSIIQSFVQKLDPIFLTAPTGTGKTSMISQLMKKSGHSHLLFTFTAQTSPSIAQIQFQSKLQTQRKSGHITLIPPPGKKFIFFIDDVNMPAIQEYGAQPPIEMLRLILGSQGVWDRKSHIYKNVQGIQMLVSGTYGRSDLPPRFVRFFNTLYLPDLQDESLTLIFSQITRGIFRNYKIKSQVLQLIESKSIVNATLQLYALIKRQLLPTPQKSHYLFNLRDVSRVMQGISIAKPSTLSSPQVLVKLWVHEFQRVFEDRLINQKDRKLVEQQIAKKVAVSLKSSLTQQTLYSEPIIFCNFLRRGLDRKQTIYQQSKDMNKLRKIINDYMQDQTKMELVLFKDAILHVCRVARTLIFQKSHILLVGLSGSGKKSLINLGAVIGQSVIQSIEVRKNYGRNEFRQDLFKIMKKAAFEDLAVSFIFPQNHMLDESFLEDINNLLSSGEVPCMFNKDSIEQINQTVGAELFLKRVLSNLHVCLTLSPIGHQFRSRIRNFPSLVNCCLIDWVDVWPEQALKSVASIKLEDNSVTEACVLGHRYIQKLCQQFFIQTRRKIYVTPKNYIQLMNTFNTFLNVQKTKLDSSIGKLSNGVHKLDQTSHIIADLKIKLTDLQPILQQKTIQQQQLLKRLEVDRAQVGSVKEVVQVQQKEIAEKAQNAMNQKKQADKILSDALPTLHAATQALNTLNRNDISQIKMNQNPHMQVKFTLECVSLLLQQRQQWESVRKTISDTNFISRLKNLDVYNIPLKVQQNLKAKLKTNPNFKPNQIKTINFAAKSLCQWVLAVLNFTDVNKEIVKKKTLVKQLNQQLNISNKALQAKRDQLAGIVTKVKQLQMMYLDSKDQKQKLDNQIILTNKRLINAEQLTDGLKNQKIRWAEYLIQLNQQKLSIVGNVFFVACCVVYYGPFTGSFRDRFVQSILEKLKQIGIRTSQNVQLKDIIGDNLEIAEWVQYSLPKDAVSIDNALLVRRTLQNPMMIDPQLQASRWIKNLQKKNDLVCLKVGSDNLLKSIQSAVRMKYPILLQTSQNTIDPSLDNLISKSYESQNNRNFVKVGETRLQIDLSYRIYVYTKIANPLFNPDIFIKLCVINFTVTPQGLQDQLLANVVENQLPQVQTKKKQLISIISKGKATLQKNQDKILELLNNSKGNILDDQELILNLKVSKKVSNQVKISLQENVVKSKQIEQARSVYEPVARRGAILYMIIAELSNIEQMYQFSLQYFTRIFNNVLSTTPGSNSIVDRIRILQSQLLRTIYTNISRGLFNQHKKILSFMMAVRIQNVPKIQYDYFNKGNFSLGNNLEKPQKNINGMDANICYSLYNLKKVFPNQIYQQFNKSNEKLNQFNENPLIFFKEYKTQPLKPFHCLLLLKTLRPQLTVDAITQYIITTLGNYFVQYNSPTMQDMYNDLNSKIPLVFILSVGADPLQNLLRLSRQRQIKQDSIYVISLGQGQQVPALKSLESASKQGGWVILQNCHLGKSFMPNLLFLTSMPCSYFPVSILQNSLKVTSEPPRGIKSNLKKLLNGVTWKQSNDQKTFTFNLCFFHAIILQRRKFGSLGWNILYDFNQSDLETSLTIVNNLLESYEEPPWQAIEYFVGEIIYGGRITDQFDRRLLKTLLLDFISPQSIQKPKIKPGIPQLYMDYVQHLNQNDNPQLFGMHLNAQTTYLYKIAKQVTDTIMLLQPQQVLSSDTSKTILMIQNLKSKIPAIIKKTKQQKYPDAIDICIQQQSIRFNKLIVFIQKNLNELIQAVKGQAIMTQVLQNTFNSLTNNQVPKAWEKLAYPSMKPFSSWFQDFIQRVTFFRNAINQRPKLYWISAFFFPQGFLTSILQIYARKQKLPVDTLGFQFNFKQQTEKQFGQSHPSDGCYIYGLYSQAVTVDFKTSVLKQSLPGVMDSEVPVIHFKPVQNKGQIPTNSYMIPVYKTKKRAGTLSTTGHSTNYIISIACRSDHQDNFWIKRGAAFFCALDK